MKSLEPFNAKDIGLGRRIFKEIVAGLGISSGNRDIDCFPESFGDLTHGLFVEGVAHRGRCVGLGRFASRSSDSKETFLLGEVIAEDDDWGR